MHNSVRIGIVCALTAIVGMPVWAGNGHMLHGFGPVNSSMAGAGAGLWLEPVGALMFNPALLAACEGSQITFATEFFKDDIEIVTTINELGAETFNNVAVAQGGTPNRTAGDTGVTDPPNQVGVLPSFGWSMRKPESPWAYGFGLVAVAGFRTDYPEDPSSILFANAPLGGFGRIYTDYRVTRIPFALAYQATDKLALGVSLNVYLGELAIAPLPHRVFEEDPSLPGVRFYAEGGNLVNEFAFAVQAGFLYTASDKISIGGSFTTEQDYDPYTWVSTFSNPFATDFSNPNTDSFGENRRLDFDLDGPFNATLGVGYKPNPKTDVAFDMMFIQYDGVEGFGSPGGIVDGIVFPFGWRDVWVYKAGIQYQASSKWTVRGGFNYSDNPIRAEVVLTATGAPATFSEHYTGGVGYKLTEQLTAEASFYVVPKEHVTGPFPDLENNRLGTMTTSNGLTSALVGLHWSF